MSVCVKKWISWNEEECKRKRVTVLFRNASLRCCAPTGPIWLLARFSVVSVCVKREYGEVRRNARERGSRCYFVMHRPDVVLRSLRFDCIVDLVWWVSVWKSGYGQNEEECKRKWVTVLFRNALARCCAPSFPIWLLARFSVVSVCVKKWIWSKWGGMQEKEGHCVIS